MFYSRGPILALALALLLWPVAPSSLGRAEIGLGLVYLLGVTAVRVYPVLRAGCSSNCKYALLGALRSVAQAISYEVRLAFLLLVAVVLKERFSTGAHLTAGYAPLLCAPVSGLLWGLVLLAETSRTPFDFSEGESELVSGFNTEYRRGGFTLFFLAEYASILFFRILTSLLWLRLGDLRIALAVGTLRIACAFVWARATLPRLRYDKLILLA